MTTYSIRVTASRSDTVHTLITLEADSKEEAIAEAIRLAEYSPGYFDWEDAGVGTDINDATVDENDVTTIDNA